MHLTNYNSKRWIRSV